MQNLTKPQNNQDALNRVYQHFIVEKNPQSTVAGEISEERCRYRSETDRGKTNGCAIGCMIPDDMYHPSIENLAITGAYKRVPALRDWFSTVDIGLLRQLQSAHDAHFDIFAEVLKGIAEEFKLEYPGTKKG